MKKPYGKRKTKVLVYYEDNIIISVIESNEKRAIIILNFPYNNDSQW